jgi:uncharacterized membrane protein
VGEYYDGSDYHGFVRDPAGNYTSLDVPGSADASFQGINNKGDIVGWFYDDAGEHSFLRSKSGVYTAFDDPGNLTTVAYGINKKGHIVGLASPSGHGYSGFLAQP